MRTEQQTAAAGGTTTESYGTQLPADPALRTSTTACGLDTLGRTGPAAAEVRTTQK